MNREIIELRNAASLDDEGVLGGPDDAIVQSGADRYYELGLIEEPLHMENHIRHIIEE